jgi:hypothetical protein
MILTFLLSDHRMFVETCQRLRLMKSSEAVNLGAYYQIFWTSFCRPVVVIHHHIICLQQFSWTSLIFPILCSTESCWMKNMSTLFCYKQTASKGKWPLLLAEAVRLFLCVSERNVYSHRLLLSVLVSACSWVEKRLEPVAPPVSWCI